MSTIANKPHKKERKAQRREERQVLKSLTRSLPPLDQPDLTFFEAWYFLTVVEGLNRLAWQRETQLANQEEWIKDLASILHWQKIYNLDLCQIKYLHCSALAMCEAILPPDGEHPPVREPWTALWLQPLAPLSFRKQQVRGMLVYRPYDLADFDHNPHFARMARRARAFWHEFFADFSSNLALEIVTYDDQGQAMPRAQGEKQDVRGARTYPFAEWDGRTWRRPADDCLTGECQMEMIGDARERILCPACRQELEQWTRWTKGVLWILEGRFRHAQDKVSAPVHEQVVETHPAIASQKKRSVYRGEIVRFDSSYFRAPHTHPGTPLLATHTIVTGEEAATLGDVDMNILIEDFTDVSGYKRTLRAKRYYPGGEVPDRGEELRRVDVRGKEHKRQYISIATWRAREEQRSRGRKQTLVYAPGYTESATCSKSFRQQ